MPKTSSEEDAFPITLYTRALDILERGINAGTANVPLGIFCLDALLELLHGGALRPDPKFGGTAAVPSLMGAQGAGIDANSPYYVGITLDALTKSVSTLFQLFGITISNPLAVGAGDWAEVLADSNVPRLFPKIISDQYYAKWQVARAQFLTTNIFTNVGTGLKTFVEAATSAADTAANIGNALATTIPESGENTS